jgi:hypothetical protein
MRNQQYFYLEYIDQVVRWWNPKNRIINRVGTKKIVKMGKAIYNKEQIIHSFSFSSNAAFNTTFEKPDDCQASYRKLQRFVTNVAKRVITDKETQKFIGDDWNIVWGPVVYSHDKNSSFARADNTMGVYYSESKNLFIIAIAGTNGISSFGWMKEDFDVMKTKSWKDITGKGYGKISKGAATGLNILTDKMEDKGAGILTALKSYILEHEIKDAELAVTGHSLGGALSPLLALYLLDKKPEWDPTKSIKISVYATAGPTVGASAGRKNFISYYQSHIGDPKNPSPDTIDYHSIKNTLDVVPLAWNQDDLAKIPTLYGKRALQDNFIGVLSLMASLSSNDFFITKKYAHIQPLTAVKGTFSTEWDDTVKKLFEDVLENPVVQLSIPEKLRMHIPNFKSIVRFFVQVGYQHTKAYDDLLKISDFTDQYNKIRKQLLVDYPDLKDDSNLPLKLASDQIGFNLESLRKSDKESATIKE